ncbi:MAG: hypothetical protein V3S46_01060 [Nitrospinota bacterium]
MAMDIDVLKLDSVRKSFEMRVLRILEKILALFMVLVVAWGVVMLLMSVKWGVAPANYSEFHVIFKGILSDLLLLVVAVEFAMMLIYHRIEYIVEIMVFVVARRMLLETGGMIDILGGVAAFAGLFAVRKYIMICPGCEQMPIKEKPNNQKAG